MRVGGTGALLDEAQTRVQLIDPALHARGWGEDLIRREETLGTVEIVDGRPRRATIGRTDYTLRVRITPDAQPVAVAVLEAKSEDKHPAYGLEQSKGYLACRRLHVPFVAATNGHQWVLFDRRTGFTTPPLPMAEFPTPDALRALYEDAVGLTLDHSLAKPLSIPYRGGEAARRYYQDAAIRATLEKLARGEKRALLSLATGSGKTWIAVNLLRRIVDAGQLKRALFVVDRDELRQQALLALQNVFGNDAAAASGSNPEPNARIVVATYQTLDIDTDDAEGMTMPMPRISLTSPDVHPRPLMESHQSPVKWPFRASDARVRLTRLRGPSGVGNWTHVTGLKVRGGRSCLRRNCACSRGWSPS